MYFNALHSEIVFRRELLDWGHYLGNETLKQSIEETATEDVCRPRTQDERTSERIRLLRFQTPISTLVIDGERSRASWPSPSDR